MPSISVEFNFALPPELTPEGIDDQVSNLVQQVAEAGRDQWERLIDTSFKTDEARNTYKKGLNPIERPNSTEAIITLEGIMPNKWEQGAESWDMKPGFLGGPNVKYTKEGRPFADIPFKTGSPFQQKIPKLPLELFNQASKMAMGERLSDKAKRKKFMSYGPNKGDLNIYEHKTGIHDALRRARDKSTDKGSHEFESFRRVSENSDPSSWIHPGFLPLLLSEQVKSYLDNQIDGIIKQFIGDL